MCAFMQIGGQHGKHFKHGDLGGTADFDDNFFWTYSASCALAQDFTQADNQDFEL